MEYFLFGLGFIILIGGASLLVDGARSISRRLGISSVIHEQTFMPASIIDLVMVLVATPTLIVFVYTGKGRKISRVEEIIMLGMYIAYTWWVISRLNP